MLHYTSLDELRLSNTWLAIGSFDGVHRGHQAILKDLATRAHAQDALAAALTFHPHPAVVLRGRSGPYYLTTLEERAELMQSLGVDEVIIHPFNREVAALTADVFMGKLCERTGLQRLVVGPDFALGRNREGNIEHLTRLGEALGYSVDVLTPVTLDGEEISSSRIRRALVDGDVLLAAALLGRPHSVSGPVSSGDGRGRTIGIPTANLDLAPDLLLPKVGVYACRVQVDHHEYAAVTNIGVRPTFTVSQVVTPRLETHLLDTSNDLYGKRIRVGFIERLRDEQRFSGVAALVEQIQIDIVRAREILAKVL